MYKIGYAVGVYDLFHIGHLNLLRNAKGLCDKLIVGIKVDELVVSDKNKQAVIPYEERAEIVRSIKYVDVVVPLNDLDALSMLKKLKFDVMFVGDDWYEKSKYQKLEKEFNEHGVQIVYFPYTKGTSSTLLNEKLREK